MIWTKPIGRPSASAINCSRQGGERRSSVSQLHSSFGSEATTWGCSSQRRSSSRSSGAAGRSRTLPAGRRPSGLSVLVAKTVVDATFRGGFRGGFLARERRLREALGRPERALARVEGVLLGIQESLEEAVDGVRHDGFSIGRGCHCGEAAAGEPIRYLKPG